LNPFIRFENVECQLPTKLDGDLYISPEQLAFVAYKPGNNSGWPVIFFGIIGFLVSAQKRDKWRDSLKGKSVEELVRDIPDSWMVPLTDVVSMQKKFPATVIVNTTSRVTYRLTVPRWPDFKEFAQKHRWPLS